MRRHDLSINQILKPREDLLCGEVSTSRHKTIANLQTVRYEEAQATELTAPMR